MMVSWCSFFLDELADGESAAGHQIAGEGDGCEWLFGHKQMMSTVFIGWFGQLAMANEPIKLVDISGLSPGFKQG